MGKKCPCKELAASTANFDAKRAKEMVPQMNKLSEALKKFALQCKAEGIDTDYEINKRRGRAEVILNLTSCDVTEQQQILAQFKESPDKFWEDISGESHQAISQRLGLVVGYLLEKMPGQLKLPPTVAKINGRAERKATRSNGGKLYKLSQTFGGIGALVCLPLELPNSTYTKYFEKDKVDDHAINHLLQLGIVTLAEDFRELTQRLILSQIKAARPLTHLDLGAEFDDVLTDSDLMLLFVTLLGGSDIPSALLSTAGLHRCQWNDEGELVEVTAEEFGIRSTFANVLRNESRRCEAIAQLPLVQNTWESATFSLVPGSAPTLAGPTAATWFITAWEIINFVCGAEKGVRLWSLELRNALWKLMEALREKRTWLMPTARVPALEAYLFFAEHGSLAIRRVAIEQVDELLEKSDSPNLHALAVLFKSILFRQDCNIAASEACLKRYAENASLQMQIKTPKYHAIMGRLHLSKVENMIHRKDPEAASLIHGGWEPTSWESTLELDTNYRMTLTATSYLSSRGCFPAAKEAYLECLKRQQSNNRRLLVIAKLADVYCELNDLEAARALVEVEIKTLREQNRKGRLYRRLLLASIEVDLGQERYFDAIASLDEVLRLQPTKHLDITDEILSVRATMARARLATISNNHVSAINLWGSVLELCSHFSSFKENEGFIDAAALVSLAQAQIAIGNMDAAATVCDKATEILQRETMTYHIPCIAGSWFPCVTEQVCHILRCVVHVSSPHGHVYTYGNTMLAEALD